jgi:hypothetical protein
MCKCCLPVRGRSSENRIRICVQLRLGSGNRRTADCWNHTSVEKGAHRRKAPASMRGGFAGAGACVRCCSPVRECSSEDRVGIRGQLRLGSGNRRTSDCWNRNSVEKGAHRRKAPAPVRVCFAGAGAMCKCCLPVREC